MKETMRGTGSVVAIRRREAHRFRNRPHCSVCTKRVWLDPVYLTEPTGAPEPNLSWVLCKMCYQVLLTEIRRSPVRSPLRLRIAMGIVASERWPQAYPTRFSMLISDRKWIIFIAVGFIVAMIVHLALVVAIAALK